ncbi:MAG: histidinol dehydrogenase [Candidatus Diapherotrites archaeon]|nr:histidinol dehydrogenase [Candidatus Diapherotrites archaeon]
MIPIILLKNKRKIQKLKERGQTDLREIEQRVRRIVQEVRTKGNTAIFKFTKKFDKVELKENRLKVTKKEIQKAYGKVSKKEIQALKQAQKNIKFFARKQLPKPFETELEKGIILGEIIRPLESVGIYVPAGRFPLPSSVLMNALPAQVAGVEKIIACSPPNQQGKINPGILVACDLAGVKEIFKIGGAQAIAGMAYGTKTIPKVNKIVGPGNIYVTLAKKEIFGETGIDFLAGPTEVMVIAGKGNSERIAADLLAQAEHDVRASAILVTWNKTLAKTVQKEVAKQLAELKTKEIAEKSIQNNSGIILVKNENQAFELANDFAPEHLEIIGIQNGIQKVNNAGGIFIGEYSCEAFGDYCSGTNHVLPTTQVAKYRAGLSTRDFVKQITYQKLSKSGAQKLAKTGIIIAEMEGLDGHAKSMKLRMKK